MINNGKTILYIATSLDGYVAGPNVFVTEGIEAAHRQALLGSGKRLFDNIGKYIELTLIKTNQYEGDLVELNYRINI